jgi:Calreticulin family
VDPDAKQPEDWDEEEDGEWEPPLISNPECVADLDSPQEDAHANLNFSLEDARLYLAYNGFL